MFNVKLNGIKAEVSSTAKGPGALGITKFNHTKT
jgi:hypothetical protein